MTKNFTYVAYCDQCHWSSGHDFKVMVDEMVKLHKESDCVVCEHPETIKYPITGEVMCLTCAMDVNTGFYPFRGNNGL